MLELRCPSNAEGQLLLGILPRGPDASAPEREVNAQVNALIQRCADGQTVVCMEPGRAMTAGDGRISKDVFFDYLHPTMAGYAILGGAIVNRVLEMMDRSMSNASGPTAHGPRPSRARQAFGRNLTSAGLIPCLEIETGLGLPRRAHPLATRRLADPCECARV